MRGCWAGFMLSIQPLPGLCIPTVVSSRAPEVIALSPTTRSLELSLPFCQDHYQPTLSPSDGSMHLILLPKHKELRSVPHWARKQGALAICVHAGNVSVPVAKPHQPTTKDKLPRMMKITSCEQQIQRLNLINYNIAAFQNVWETLLEMKYNTKDRKSKSVGVKQGKFQVSTHFLF